MCKRAQARNATTKRYHKTQALMGATRLASGIFQQPRSLEKITQNVGSQIALTQVSDLAKAG